MTLQQLRDFVAVISHGGFRSAARALSISQGRLTKSLAKLEEEHGVQLLDRNARGVTLTDEGQTFLRHARTVLLEADQAQRYLQGVRDRPAYRVSLGVSVEPSLRLASAVLADFGRVCPGIAIHVTQSVTTELISAVRENRIEVALARIPADFAPPDLDITALYDATTTLVGRVNHPLANAASMQDIAECEWIVVGDPMQPASSDESIKELFDARNLDQPKIAVVTDSLFVAISLLANSDYLARLPRTALDHPLASSRLIEIPIRNVSDSYTICIVQKVGRVPRKEVLTLVSMLASFSRIDGHLRAS